MKPQIVDFCNLPVEEKIAICNKCQKILGEYFPESEYTLTKQNMSGGIKFYRKLIDDFKGQAFVCDDAVVFFKKNNMENPHNKQGEFLRIYKQPHVDNGNCVFIEFIAADIHEDNFGDLEQFFFGNKTVEYFMASRRGVIYLDSYNSLKSRAERLGSKEKFISSLTS